MAIKMLVFDYRETEHKFFAENKLENYDIKFFNFSLNEETIENVPDEDKKSAAIVSVFVDSLLTKEIINCFKNLRMIAMRSTGYDNVDKNTCIQRNIAVLNVQNYGETSVAEFTIGLIIMLTRKITQAYLSVKDNNFENKSFVGRDLKELTLGVIGTGAIGAAVCKLANAFGMKILAYDLSSKTELTEKYKVEYTTLEKVISNSDIITLHLPYTGSNYHMFSKHEFEQMKKGAYFINVARGELVDNIYLKENIDNGKISGAALDVVACKSICEGCYKLSDSLEMSSLDCLKDSDIIKELICNPNVIVTPHMAYESQDSIDFILRKTFEGIQDCIEGGSRHRVI